MAARLVDKLPEGPEWLYELKFDGYRALLIKDGAEVRLLSRKAKDLTSMYPGVARAGEQLKPAQVMLDGEIVALDEQGKPAFQALERRGHAHVIVFYAFDLLYLNGSDLTRLPLNERRAKLPQAIKGSGVLLSSELSGTADQVIETVRNLHLEGIVAKRRDSLYAPGERSGAWVKLVLSRQEEFVIGGYRPAGDAVDALLVGYYDGEQLRCAAKVAAGFVPYTRRELYSKLKPLETARCPFVDLPQGRSRWGSGVTAEEMHEMRWVKPQLVAQVRFLEWTAERRLRHSVIRRASD